MILSDYLRIDCLSCVIVHVWKQLYQKRGDFTDLAARSEQGINPVNLKQAYFNPLSLETILRSCPEREVHVGTESCQDTSIRADVRPF
jgi:hypothetical protein